MVADEVRRQADFFIDLHDLEADIARTGGPNRGNQSFDDYDDEEDEEDHDEDVI